jgi:hypothetical protein
MRKSLCTAIVLGAAGLSGMALSTSSAEPVLGYTDTPMLPAGKWHVHDPDRPRPPVVNSGATFSHGAAAPSDATVLFDGTDLSKWEGDKGEPKWIIHQDYMQVTPGSGYIHTKEKFGDFQLHLEFAEPTKVVGDSQERGNSGVFLQGVYEIQVLDSYNNPTYPDGSCGAIYGQSPPLVNACKKPGQWQTYDIIFEAARWNACPACHRHRHPKRSFGSEPSTDLRPDRAPHAGQVRQGTARHRADCLAGSRQPHALP